MTIAVDAVIAQSELAVVRIPYVQVYGEGMTVALERLTDHYAAALPDMPGPGRRATDDPDGFLFGLRYSDGREGDTDVNQPAATQWRPRDRILFGGGAGTGLPNRWYWRYWVWPLPAPGPMWFRCHWPEVGIDDSSYELDSAPLLAAARRSAARWSQDDLPRPPGMDGS